jgi:hypothetical protein
MKEQTLKDQWIELAKVRGWLINRLPAESDQEIRHSLFEAHQAIGFALLQLERVEFRTDGTHPSGEND